MVWYLLLLTTTLFANPCVHIALGTDVGIQEAQKTAQHILANRGPVKEVTLNPWPEHLTRKGIERPHGHAEQIEIRGYPSHISQISTKGKVFRHYTYDKSTLDSIISSQALINGSRVYDEGSPGLYHRAYLDLHGIFLTVPGVSAYSVGVGSRNGGMFYVDIEIPDEVPVLEMKKNSVYLVPLERQAPEWMIKMYQEYKAGKMPEDRYLKSMSEMDEQGGPKAPRAIPIKVIATGQE